MTSTSESSPQPNISKRRLLQEGTWVLLGRVLTVLASLVGMRLLTEVVPPPIYAEIGLLLGIAGLANLFFFMPLLQAAFRFFPDLHATGRLYEMRQLLGKVLLLSAAALLALFVVGGTIRAYLIGGSYLVMIALAMSTVAEVGQTFETTLLTAARRQRAVAVLTTISAWAKPLAAIAMVFLLGASASAVFLGYLLATTLLLAALHLSGFPLVGKRAANDAPDSHGNEQGLSADFRQQIVSYALPLLPLALVGWIHSLGDRYIIERLIGLKQAAFYIAAYGIVTQPFNMVENILQQTLQPAYNQVITTGDTRQMKRIFRLWLAAAVAIVIFGCICFALLSGWVATLLVAKEYRSCATLMPLLSVGVGFLAVAHVFEYRLYSLKRTKLILLGQTIGAIASVLLAVPMIWFWGLRGAALACPSYYAVYLLAMGTLSHMANAQYLRDLAAENAPGAAPAQADE